MPSPSALSQSCISIPPEVKRAQGALEGRMKLSVQTSLACLLFIFADGCGTGSLRYSTAKVMVVPGATDERTFVTEPIDARNNGRPAVVPTFAGRDPHQEMDELRAALREHIGATGLATSLSPVPTTPAEVDATLDAAVKAGVHEVVFLRFLGANSSGHLVSLAACSICGILPWIIVDSIYLSRHGATGFFEAVVVDPQSHDVLANPVRVASFGEHVSAWGYDPTDLMHRVIRASVDAVVRDVVIARKAGYPKRQAEAHIEDRVLAGPWVRIEEGRVSAPGFSVAL